MNTLHPIFKAALSPYIIQEPAVTEATTDQPIEQLVEKLAAAKAAENAFKKQREEIEAQIVERLGAKPEGSQTHELANGVKVTITGKMTYSADMDMLMQLANNLPPSMRPIKMDPKLDETGAKFLRNNEPEIWAQLAPAITIKPAKTSVTIKV